MIRMEGNNANPYGDGGSGLNIPSNIKGNIGRLSPYLNFDPVYLPPSQPEYIFPEGASGTQRGRFEKSFSQIGGGLLLGAAYGGTVGFWNGLRVTTLAGQTGHPRAVQVLNHVIKRGSATSNTMGVILLCYSAFGTALHQFRSAEDELNTLGAATLTGLFYKSTAGLRKCAVGGAIGFGIAAVYCLYTSRDHLQQFRMQLNPA